MIRRFLMLLLTTVFCATVHADISLFHDGPIIKGFGKHAPVETSGVYENTQLKVVFDIGKAAESGKLNHRIDSLARFINMNAASGVKPENIELAVVVHGKASFDILNDATYNKLNKSNNPNKALVNVLMENNTRIILCGQTAAAYDISQAELIDGVEIALSAMTAHALLQQQGYTLNPF